MFGFSRKHKKLGRVKKVQLSDTSQGTRTPIRHPKRNGNSNGDGVAGTSGHSSSEEIDYQVSSTAPEISNCASGSSENWMVLSIAGDKPVPRSYHAACVIENKMIAVGGESGNGLLDDVQVLNFDTFSWTTVSSKLYLSPSSLPLQIPACKGHCLVSWGKKALLIGGKTDPGSDKISVWAFDTETECWSLMEAKGDIPTARSGHTIVRANSTLILFGGEDCKKRKLNDLHMFDLKSLTWLPLHCTGTAPSPRCNHVTSLYNGKILFVFGGVSKSRTLNDLYSLDFETMAWSRIKVRGFHPSPRAGCCGVLCGTKWYIAGGGSRKKRHGETLIYDIKKSEWFLEIASPPSSITTNKGFSLVLVQHKENDFLVAFGGSKKEASNQVEVLKTEKNESASRRHPTTTKGSGSILEKHSSSSQHRNDSSQRFIDSIVRQNLISAIEHGSERKSLSEALSVQDSGSISTNISLHSQFDPDLEFNVDDRGDKHSEDESSFPRVADQRTNQNDTGHQMNTREAKINMEEQVLLSGDLIRRNLGYGNTMLESDHESFHENVKSGTLSTASNIYNCYETKLTSLTRKFGILEAQLAASLEFKEAAEKNLASASKSKQEMDKKMTDALKEIELLREKLVGAELAQEEANNLSDIVHSDNVRLEHDVAFLKAILDDTQKELQSTRGVLAGERARAFQLQVEVFHLKQRLQSMENRAPTPRKPFHV
ncbi:acyl-CoA-binding domain-containing protein 6-like [Vicia villosa]|uniref:acyl-CoA-binding domain-containing protein 6-like n=1 Tax=Vicia villosa TaxID=3911 RepID=UPI00273CE794|nr:acyl-CoA-binding domain-containing protein 6-like [Vicia villosa]XP_058764917.1 acyl-CoA-binding domain-containing protein 6-like [Vicia villosa]XP_058764918.1 acyl-CoA-binding domain-containing protein 6-like [Vicia villosa]